MIIKRRICPKTNSHCAHFENFSQICNDIAIFLNDFEKEHPSFAIMAKEIRKAIVNTINDETNQKIYDVPYIWYPLNVLPLSGTCLIAYFSNNEYSIKSIKLNATMPQKERNKFLINATGWMFMPPPPAII